VKAAELTKMGAVALATMSLLIFTAFRLSSARYAGEDPTGSGNGTVARQVHRFVMDARGLKGGGEM
jgi:hypothetical protein